MKKNVIIIFVFVIIFIVALSLIKNVSADHAACSNTLRESKETRSHPGEKERQPKQKPQTTTTTIPVEPPDISAKTTTTTTSNIVVGEVRCAVTSDCNIGFVCCQNVCKKENEGICRDANGDGVPDWIPYVV